MNVEQIRSAIMFNDLSNSEINLLADALKYARSQLTKQVRRSLQVGDLVQFTDSRRGIGHRGVVDKINVKYVIVTTANGKYRVPANMLNAV